VVAEWLGTEGNTITIQGARDETHGFAAGQWVELIHDKLELQGKPGTLVKVERVEGDMLIINEDQAGNAAWSGELSHPKVRRWDQVRFEPQGGSPQLFQDGAILLEKDAPIPLEQGIWIEFPDTGAHFRTGDYWLIPARTATRDIEWPRVEGEGRREAAKVLDPHGIVHHYAPLAIVKEDDGITDLRCKINPVIDCTVIFDAPA
jgi:hypothetical protein